MYSAKAMLNQDDHAYRILVVEDNLADYVLVQELIAEKIVTPIIELSRTFREAKHILTATDHHFNVVILDLSLPDSQGEALIHEMISLCPTIPIIVLTGHTDFDFGIRSLAMGISDYLLKDDLNATNLYKSIVYSIERKEARLALEMSEKRIRNFAMGLNTALEIERSRFAREIHDEFGQQLSGLKMSLSALKRSYNAGSAALASIDSLIAEIDTSIASIRLIANELRPILLDKLGLLATLEWLTEEFEKKSGVSSFFVNEASGMAVDKLTAINIFRICQEAFTNIAKHANASRVNVHIQETDGNLSIKISDNGDGISSQIISDPLSMGLLNMEERAHLIGAQLKIESVKSFGTTIELNVKA